MRGRKNGFAIDEDVPKERLGIQKGGLELPKYPFLGWLRHSLDGPVEGKSVLFLSIFVASYQFVWNGFALSFALMLWVNRLRVRMDVVSEKPIHWASSVSSMPSKECYSEATDKRWEAVLKSVCSSFSCRRTNV